MKTSQNNKNYHEKDDMIARYVYAVTKSLPLKSRKDIEEELITLIYDMLEERVGDVPPAKKDIDMVLRELGDPKELSEKYMDNKRYLIGPSLFHQYIMVLKIVVIAVGFGVTIASIIEIITISQGNISGYSTASIIENVVDYFANWMAAIISGISSACAWVTLIFAVLEWRGIETEKISSEWDVNTLPQVPSIKATIPRTEPIVGIIFIILAAILFTFAPQLMGVINIGETNITIPVFQLSVLEKILPLFLICFGLGILREILKLIEGRHTIRLAITTVVLDLISLFITIFIFTRYEIWNPNFMADLNKIYDLAGEFPIDAFWSNVPTLFLGVLILAFVIDSAETLYKSIRYGISN